jgi:hypothetical protein
MHQIGMAFPLPVIAGVLGFQLAGWSDGKRMFATLNSEAMLFVCSVGGLAFFWWLLGKFDASDDANAFTGRTAWWASLITGP